MTLRDAMNRLFQDSFVAAAAGDMAGERMLYPYADVSESEDEVTIEMAVPGANTDLIDVTYEQDSVVVRGEIPARDEERTWILRERPRGRFERRFTLNVPINGEKADASYRNGILVLTLPKRDEVKPRKIEVHASK